MQALEGVVDRKGLIELVVIELVVPEGGEERPDTVLRQLAVVVVGEVGELARVETEAREGRGEEPDAAVKQAPPERLRLGRKPARDQARAPEQRVTDERRREKSRIDQRHRVRLPDVVHHLLRVDEVVDGDEVEADAKLVPEHPLRHRAEEHQAERPEQDEMTEAAPEGLGEELRREHHQQQAERNGEEQAGAEIVDRADQEGRRQAEVEGDIPRGLHGERDPDQARQQNEEQDEDEHPAVAAGEDPVEKGREFHGIAVPPAGTPRGLTGGRYSVPAPRADKSRVPICAGTNIRSGFFAPEARSAQSPSRVLLFSVRAPKPPPLWLKPAGDACPTLSAPTRLGLGALRASVANPFGFRLHFFRAPSRDPRKSAHPHGRHPKIHLHLRTG